MDNPETTQSETNKPKKNKLRLRARKATAILAGVTAFAGFSDAAFADAPATPNTPTLTKIKEIPRHELRSLSEVTRHEQQLNPEIIKAQQQATLELMERHKNPDGTPSTQDWQPAGTGMLVQEGQTLQLDTASHVLGATTGLPFGSTFSPDPSIKAYDYTSRATTYEYAVADPTTPLSYRKTHPIGYVDRINIAADGNDMAALRIVDSGIAQTEGRRLTQIKPFEYQFAPKAPRLGTPVSLYGMPAANGFEPIGASKAKAFYLRRERYVPYVNDGVSQPIQRDVVAVLAPTPKEDVCNEGSSGFTGVVDIGKLGVLSARNSIGYGPHKVMQDTERRGLQNNIRDRHTLEQELRVSLPNKYILCYFTVPGPDTMAALQNATPVPPVPSA